MSFERNHPSSPNINNNRKFRAAAMAATVRSPSTRTRALPRMTTIADLLDAPSLVQFIRYFERIEDNLDELLQLDEKSWTGLIDHVADTCRDDGIKMSYVHKELIKTRLRGERAQRTRDERAEEDAERDYRESNEPGFDQHNGMQTITVHNRDDLIDENRRLPSAHGQYCMEGFSCLPHNERKSDEENATRSAIFCFFICVLALTISLLLHYLNNSGFSDGGSPSNTGGWNFIEVLAVLGWIISSIAFCTCVYTLSSDPQARQNTLSLPDCFNEPLCEGSDSVDNFCPTTCSCSEGDDGFCPEITDCLSVQYNSCMESCSNQDCFRPNVEMHAERGRTQAKLETAKNMLNNGMSPELVAEYTNLPINQVMSLR